MTADCPLRGPRDAASRSRHAHEVSETMTTERSSGTHSLRSADKAKPAPRRKQVLLRLHPHLYDALARWAGDELRSTNAQIEFLLRIALTEAGRHPTAPRAVSREIAERSGDIEPAMLRRRTG